MVRLKREKPFPMTRLSRALMSQKLIMLWESFIPSLAPVIVWALGVLLGGVWNLWEDIVPSLKPLVVWGSFGLSVIFSLMALKNVKWPNYREGMTRLAIDNKLTYEKLLGVRHQDKQPALKILRPRAGLAKGDPLALRFVIILAALFGLWIKGIPSLNQLLSGFM